MPSKNDNTIESDGRSRKRQVDQAAGEGPVAEDALLEELPAPLIAQRLQRAPAGTDGSRPQDILALQRAYGNQAVTRLLVKNQALASQAVVQPKLTVGPADDVYEQEADRMAEQVASMPAAGVSFPSAAGEAEGGTQPVRRQAEEEEELQMKPLLQRQAEEEEELQMKPLLQRQAEEEEELQMKPLLQRQAEEEEELQMKPLLQRQAEEEEELQMKPFLQRQAEEEEELQMKPLLQRQAEEEEELQMKPLLQRQAEEEEDLQMKPLVQRQAEEEEELQMKPLLQRQAEEEEELQPKSSTDGSFEAGSSLESRLAAQRGGGSELPADTRSFMEPRLGADLSAVRVHTGSDAVQMNRDIQSQAFTHGTDIHFGAGKYDPGSQSGKQLLAHELTHVVQQRPGLKDRLQRVAKPDAKVFSKNWWLTKRLEKKARDNLSADATKIVAKLHANDSAYYNLLLRHKLEKHEGNSDKWKLYSESAPADVRKKLLYELVVVPRAYLRWRKRLSDSQTVELAEYKPEKFLTNVMKELQNADELEMLHSLLSLPGMATELKRGGSWDKFETDIHEPHKDPKGFIDNVLIPLRDGGKPERVTLLLMVPGMARTLKRGAGDEWKAFAVTVLDPSWVYVRGMGPDMRQELIEQDPKVFIQKVLVKLKNEGRTNNLYQALTDRGVVETLSRLGGDTWKTFAADIRLLQAMAKVKGEVEKRDLKEPMDIVDEIFKAFISQDDIKIGYYPASDLDSPGQIMLGEPDESREERLKDREQRMAKMGQQMPDQPSTQCDSIVKLLQTMIKLYPGLDNVVTHPDIEPQALLTKPMNQQAGGVIPNTFEGTVYDAKGAKTGRILFTGTSKEAPNSHTWLVVVAGDETKPYDGVLGSAGQTALNNSREPAAFRWTGKLWEDGGGNKIRQLSKRKMKKLPPPNSLGFGTSYQIIAGPLSNK